MCWLLSGCDLLAIDPDIEADAGSMADGAAAADGAGGMGGCSVITLTGDSPIPQDGDFGTLKLTGAGATFTGTTALASKSLMYNHGVVLNTYVYASAPGIKGKDPRQNATTMIMITKVPGNELHEMSVQTYGATPDQVTVLWQWVPLGSPPPPLAGMTYDAAGKKVTFVNSTLRGVIGNNSGDLIMNGTFCLP